jgi:phosphate transport system permease protein
MTDTSASPAPRRELKKRSTSEANVRRRYAKERRFQIYGIAAIGSAILMLAVLMVTIVANGYSAFFQNEVALSVKLDKERLGLGDNPTEEQLARATYRNVVRDALSEIFPDVTGRQQRRALFGLVSSGSDLTVRDAVLADPSILGSTQIIWVKTSDDVDTYLKGQMTEIAKRSPPGVATPAGTTGDVRISVDSNAFAEIEAEVKRNLIDFASERDARRVVLVDILADEEKQLASLRAASAAPAAIARVERALQDTRSQIDKLAKQVVDLRERASNAGTSEKVTSDLPSYLVRINGGLVKITEIAGREVKGTALLPLANEASAQPGTWEIVSYVRPEDDRRVKDQEIAWISKLQAQDSVEQRFDVAFFQTGDSREPEQAGVWGAVVGSFLTLVVTLLISFPIGVLAATYLEEFAPKNRWTDLIEVNINNLAAVPSIVFGLLGLAVFLNFFGLPRSAPVVGGMVLALMTLPTIIIASRAALKSVPPSIRQAALGMGASRIQTVTHHVLPLAMPGILTGTIIGMAQALGETAPLLMIGMVAFIVDVPGGFTDPATVMPVQIYLWADSPERAFVAKTSAAIMVLLAFLILMNFLAVLLRKRFERRW